MAVPRAQPGRVDLRPLDEETARAVLRGDRRPDWAAGYPTEGDLDISRFLTDRPVHGAPELFKPYQIVLAETGTVIGGIGCHRPPDHRGVVEIGYGIAPEWRNQGLTTEAVGTLVSALAANPAVRKVIARTAPDNVPSQRVLLHNGFAEKGWQTDGFVLWERPIR